MPVVVLDPAVAFLAELTDAGPALEFAIGTGRGHHVGFAEQAEFPYGQLRTADSLIATLATRAGMLVMPERELEATLGPVRAYLASRPETAFGEFTLPMLTGVLRVRRLPSHRRP